MPRRKPASAKQRKADLQLRRAIKRGDTQHLSSTSHHHPTISPDPQPSSRRLQSSFVKLSREFLDATKHVASAAPLLRPIPQHCAILPSSVVEHPYATLTVPKRPKWKYDMDKKMLENNEEAIFAKWLTDTNNLVDLWLKAEQDLHRAATLPHDPNVDIDGPPPPPVPPLIMPPSPTHYEHNIEVWRQLWRVTEISQILMILLDSRCPAIHYPPSLHAYLTGLRPPRRLILVLTKIDISGPIRAAKWTEYLETRYPDVRVVQVESYVERAMAAGQGKRKKFEPFIPTEFRRRLVEALRDAHQELCTPPQRIQDDEEKLKNWRPSVRSDVDWEAVLTAGGADVGKEVGGALAPMPSEGQPADEAENLAFLTIGLIGQPNVGKSSLLNAIFGAHKVKASRTPGKTKHFQTLFWTPHVRLVDCPGLVMPNYVPLEMQVLAGTLPISQISSIASCVHRALELLPLERILGLAHPAGARAAVAEDKRTWRDGKRPVREAGGTVCWTAMDVLTAYAEKQGWVTAKAGRPDVNRAGNHVLRSLAEARIQWAFWPPGTDVGEVGLGDGGDGIWIGAPGHLGEEHGYSDSESEEEEAGAVVGHEGDQDDASTEEEDEEDEEESVGGRHALRRPVTMKAGMFSALAQDGNDEDGDD